MKGLLIFLIYFIINNKVESAAVARNDKINQTEGNLDINCDEENAYILPATKLLRRIRAECKVYNIIPCTQENIMVLINKGIVPKTFYDNLQCGSKSDETKAVRHNDTVKKINKREVEEPNFDYSCDYPSNMTLLSRILERLKERCKFYKIDPCTEENVTALKEAGNLPKPFFEKLLYCAPNKNENKQSNKPEIENKDTQTVSNNTANSDEIIYQTQN